MRGRVRGCRRVNDQGEAERNGRSSDGLADALVGGQCDNEAATMPRFLATCLFWPGAVAFPSADNASSGFSEQSCKMCWKVSIGTATDGVQRKDFARWVKRWDSERSDETRSLIKRYDPSDGWDTVVATQSPGRRCLTAGKLEIRGVR